MHAIECRPKATKGERAHRLERTSRLQQEVCMQLNADQKQLTTICRQLTIALKYLRRVSSRRSGANVSALTFPFLPLGTSLPSALLLDRVGWLACLLAGLACWAGWLAGGACLLACWLAGSLACLLAALAGCLLACLRACLPACLLACLLGWAGWLAGLLACCVGWLDMDGNNRNVRCCRLTRLTLGEVGG